MNFTVYKDKKILVTGHTGFKGSWLCIWLELLGAKLAGYALDPKTGQDNFVLSGLSKSMSDYRCDIRDKSRLFQVVADERPDIIFHLAAQPLVLESYQNPLETIETNTLGTANMLEAFRRTETCQLLVVITTDKVYDNVEWSWGYRESDRLGGKDPYSASKAAIELIVNAYSESFFIASTGKKVVTVRAGNVIGGGDWSENRIIPDCVKAIEANKAITIRNPKAIRPWQHVLEPLGGYLLIGEKVLTGEVSGAGAWNFGPLYQNQVTVEKLVRKFIEHYSRGTYTIQKNYEAFREAHFLSLDISKAVHELGWHPSLSFEETVALTAEWYKNRVTADIRALCEQQIKDFVKLWNSKNEN